MADFLSMGGYAPYVWSAYGVTAAVLLSNLLGARRRHRKSLERLQVRMKRQSIRSSR